MIFSDAPTPVFSQSRAAKVDACSQSSHPDALANHLHPFPNSSVVIQSLPLPLWRGPSLHMSSAAAPAASASQGSSFLLFGGLIAKTCAQISPSSIKLSVFLGSSITDFSFNCELCAQHYDSEKAFVPAVLFTVNNQYLLFSQEI